jgi:hypothetical protein
MSNFPLKHSTAVVVPLGPYLDATDGNSEETGLTITSADVRVWKRGATSLVPKNSGGATHMEKGIFYCTLDSTDTNTLGPLVIYVHIAGSLFTKEVFHVMTSSKWEWEVNGDPTFAASGVWGALRTTYDVSNTYGEVITKQEFLSAMFDTTAGTFAQAVTGSPVYEITNNAGTGDNTAVLAAIAAVSTHVSIVGASQAVVSLALTNVSAAVSSMIVAQANVSAAVSSMVVTQADVSAAVSSVGARVTDVSTLAAAIAEKTGQMSFSKPNHLIVDLRAIVSASITGDGINTPFTVRS